MCLFMFLTKKLPSNKCRIVYIHYKDVPCGTSMNQSLLFGLKTTLLVSITSADPEGGTGGPDPPWKITSYMGSIGDKQLDPPPPWKMLDPLWNLKNDRFLRN